MGCTGVSDSSITLLDAAERIVFSPARRGTTLLFAQCVYLMFAGVYVAKEAVEHLLLSAGGNTHGHGHGGGATRGPGDGHHHHWGDEKPETLG